MGEFKDVAHLIRLAGVFLLGLILFLVFRSVTIPKSFGRYGPFRGASWSSVHGLWPLQGMRPARTATPMLPSLKRRVSTSPSTASHATDRLRSTRMIQATSSQFCRK